MNGSDLSFSMLIRLMDGWSGPADKVRQSMRSIATGSRDLQRQMSKKVRTGFSATELEAAFSRSEQRINRARSRLLGAAGMAVTLAAPAIQAGNFEEKLIDFGNLAEVDAERLARLKGELNDLRAITGQSNTQLLDGLATYVGKGMDVDEALASLAATGRAAKATKSQFNEMANSGFAVMDNLGVAPDRLRKAFDIMAKSGKEGSFELAAMARKFPEITAGAKSLKMDGVDAVASLSAALQIAMKSAGSEDQAATNMTNFLGKITAPDTVKKFKKFGVDVEKEMRIALERGADPLEHMLLVIREMTDGDAFKMGKLFADKQVLDFLRAMIPNMKEYQRIKKEALGADGVIDADYERVMAGFNEEMRQLKNSTAALLGASGALLPVFTDIVREVRLGVDAVAGWTSANPELTATLVKGSAALLAFGIGTRVLSYGFAVMQGGLLRTAALFLKFDKSGKNISIMGRSMRVATRAARGLFSVVRSPVKWGLKPLVWTGRLVPRIPWRSLLRASVFPWSLVLKPLAWTPRLLPNFAAPLAAFAGFRAAASKEITGLSRHVSMQSAAMRRNLSRVRWGAIGVAMSMAALAAQNAPEPLPEDPAERAAAIERNNKKSADRQAQLDASLRAVPGLGWAMGTYDKALAYRNRAKTTPQGDPDAVYRQHVAPHSSEEELRRKGQYTPGVDPAQAARISAMLDRNAKLHVQSIKEALAPVTAAIREGKASAQAVATSARPQARPYDSAQPNVTVESTFESNPKLDVSVKVDMPISIKREQKVDNAAIAREAGRQTGAATERAVRRRLDDAAITE